MGHPLFDLTGRVAVVSDTASGLGRAMATGFAEAGADLVLLDINPEGNARTVETITGLGRRALPVQCDVSDAVQIRAAFAAADQTFGRVDILGNVAGDGYREAPEEEAQTLLKECRGKARLIAGGTDLIPEIREGLPPFEVLVDIEKLKKLKTIREESKTIFIGSGVTFSELEESKIIRNHAFALHQAASLMGSPQVRNRGTIGGNIVSAQPAADGALALFAFDAVLELAGMRGIREIPISQAYVNIGESAINPSREIL